MAGYSLQDLMREKHKKEGKTFLQPKKELTYEQSKALDTMIRKYYDKTPQALPAYTDEQVRKQKEASDYNYSTKKRYDVSNRDNYPYPVDPQTYGAERNMKKADPTYKAQEMEGKLEDQNWFREQQKDLILKRFEKNPNDVSVQDLWYATGRLPQRNSKIPWDTNKDATAASYITKDTYQNQKAINTARKKDGLTAKFDKQTPVDQLSLDNPDSAILTKANIRHLNDDQLKNLKQAKNDGKKYAMVDYYGEIRKMKINDAIKYAQSGAYQTQYDLKKGNAGLVKSTISDFKDLFGQGFNSLDSLGQGVRSAYKAGSEKTGIDTLKMAKPLVDAEGMWMNRLLPWRWNDIKGNEKDTLKNSAKQSWDEMRQIRSNWKGQNPLDVAGTMAKGFKQGFGDAFTGKSYYDKSKQVNGYDLLTREGYDPKARSTKVGGFGLDIVSSVLPSSGEKEVLMKGGKPVIKNSPKVLKALEDKLMNFVGEHEDGVNLANKIIEKFKKDGQLSSSDIDNIYSEHRQSALNTDRAGRKPFVNYQSPRMFSSDYTQGKIYNLEDAVNNMGVPIPKTADFNTRLTNIANKAEDTYNKAPKNVLDHFDNAWENRLTDLYKEVEARGGLPEGANAEDYLSEIWGQMAKPNDPSFKTMFKLANKTPDELAYLLSKQRNQQVYGLDVQKYPTGKGLQYLEAVMKPNQAKDVAKTNMVAKQFDNEMEQFLRETDQNIKNVKGFANRKEKLLGKIDDLNANLPQQLARDRILQNIIESQNIRRVRKNGLKQGELDRKFLDNYDTNNSVWQQFLKEQAMGPLSRNKGISMFGQEIIPSEVMSGVGKIAMNNPIGRFLENNRVTQGLRNNFDRDYGVSDFEKSLLYNTQGKTNYETAMAQKDLKELLKGFSKNDLKQSARNWVRPTTEKAPEKLTDELRKTLQLFSDRSFNRDSQFNPDLPKLENYLTGVYKSLNEKEIEKAIPGYFNKNINKPYSHKEKKYENFLDAMEQNPKLKAVEDIGKLMMKRESDSIDWSNRKALDQQVKDLQAFNPNLISKRGEDYINSYLNPDVKARSAVGKLAKNWNDYWKTATMTLFPATGMRNLYGGIVNNHLDGVGAKDYLRAIAPSKLGVKLKDGTKMSGDEYTEKAMKQGIDQGQLTSDIGDTLDNASFGKTDWLKKLNPASRDFIAFDPGKKLQGKVEEVLRNARFIKGLDDYGRTGAKEAGADVRASHFDYNPRTALTDTEQKIRDYVMPFYTFTRFNLPFQAKQLAQNPSRMNLWGNMVPRAFENNGKDPREDAVNVPDYMSKYLHLGNGDLRSANWNSVNDFKDWADPVQKVAGALNPLIKAPIDAFAGFNKGVGSDFVIDGQQSSPFDNATSQGIIDKAPWLANVLDLEQTKNSKGDLKYKIDGHKGQAVRDLIPQLSNITALAKQWQANPESASFLDKLKSVATSDKGIDLLTGMGKKTFDPAISNYYDAINAQNQAKDEVLQLQQDGKLPKDLNKLPEFKQPTPDFDIERAYMDGLKWTQTPEQRIEQGQLDHPYVKKDQYGNRFTYDIFGNIVDWKAPYPAKTDAVRRIYEEYARQVEEGKRKSEQDMAMYQMMQNTPPTLEDYYKQEGVAYPYKDAYEKTLRLLGR